MALSATQVSTISTMQSGGIMSVPVDSRTGQVYRPTLQGAAGSPLSTFERYFDFFIDNVPDPDTALAMNPAFDELMRQQPDAHAAFLIREQTVAQYDWTINPADGDGIPGFDVALAAQVANYAKSVFNGLDMTALHEEMQQAISLGGAGHEFIWQPGFDGVERPKGFLYIHKSNYVFDRLGNQALLTRGTPVWGSYSSANTSQPPAPVKFSDGRYASYFPDGKFIYHRYQALGGSWTRPAEAGYQYWGRGEDTRIYILVTAAQAVFRFWLKFLERWGIPPTDIYFPDNLRPSAEVQSIVSDAINGATNAIPRQIGQPYDSMYHIETRNPPSGSNEYFFTFLNSYVAPKIRMIILGSADEQQNSGASGGYSDHVSRKESGSGVVFRRDGLRISETLNRQLIPHIVLRKFRGLPAMYWPKHSLLAEEERDRKQELEIAQIVSSLVPIKEDEVYERSGFTKPEEGDKIVFNKQGPGMDDPFAAAMAGGEPPEGLRGPGPASEGKTPNAGTGQGDDAGAGAIAQGGGDFSAYFEAAFDERKHPRGGKDNPGQFAPKGSATSGKRERSQRAKPAELHSAIKQGKGKDSTLSMSDGSPLPSFIKPTMIPPAYAHKISVAKDEDADVWAVAEDENGKRFRVYNPKFEQANKDIKWGRVGEGVSIINDMRSEIARDRGNPESDAAWLMSVQGTRPGSEEDTKGTKALWNTPISKNDFVITKGKNGDKVELNVGGKKPIHIRDAGAAAEIQRRLKSGESLEDAGYWLKSFGATTLEPRHVVQSEDGIHLQFMGKEGVWHDHKIDDPALAKMLVDRKNAGGKTLFGTDYNKVAKYVGGLGGGGFSPKDLRTIRANELAGKLIGDGKVVKNDKERETAIMEIATKVSRLLGNRPKQARESYIDPMVFDAIKVK